MSNDFTDSIEDQVSYEKHHAHVLERLAKLDGQDVHKGAVVIFVDRKEEELSLHGVNLTSDELKAVLYLATSDMQTDLARIKAQIEKELTNPNQH